MAIGLDSWCTRNCARVAQN